MDGLLLYAADLSMDEKRRRVGGKVVVCGVYAPGTC